jgi:hypothetical protein
MRHEHEHENDGANDVEEFRHNSTSNLIHVPHANLSAKHGFFIIHH